MCESSGLILRSFIYSGLPYPDIHDLGQTGAIVLKLMEDFLGKGYTVFADNYYNSVKLTNFMSKKQTYICGTLRSDRKGNPKEVVSKKLKKGEVEWKRRETVVVSKWKDKRDVLTISNKHKLELVPVKNKRGEVRMKPNIVRDYIKWNVRDRSIRPDVVLLSRIAEKYQVVQKDWISFHRDVRAQLILSFQASKSPK